MSIKVIDASIKCNVDRRSMMDMVYDPGVHTPQVIAFMENVAALKRTLRQVAAQAYGDLGVGETQMKVLRHLGTTRTATQAELARATETDPALLGRALRPMLKRGELSRSASREDGRAWVVTLSPRGAALLGRVNEASARLVQRLAAPLDARDFADFHRVTQKLVQAVDARKHLEDEPATRFVTRRVPTRGRASRTLR